MWATAAIALGSGVVGLIFGLISNSRSKKANDEAERANQLAARALEAAEKSNRIAEDANKLSEQANALSGRTHLKETEDWHVDWTAKWDGPASAIRIVNKGRHVARDVSVLVHYEGVHEYQRLDKNIEPGCKTWVFLPKTSQHMGNLRLDTMRTSRSMLDAGYIGFNGIVKATLEVTVSWQTGEGFSRNKSINVEAT